MRQKEQIKTPPVMHEDYADIDDKLDLKINIDIGLIILYI